MANNNIQPKSPEQKAQAADSFAKSLATMGHANNNVTMYPTPCDMLIDAYREKLCSSILKKHKALQSRDPKFLLEGIKRKNPLYTHLKNIVTVKDRRISYLEAVEMQRDAWRGKYDTKFIKDYLDSCNEFLTQSDKEKALKQA